MSEIRWLQRNECELECPACKNQTAETVLSTSSPASPDVSWEIVKCKTCDTHFYTDTEKMIGYHAENVSDAGWNHYLQLGAGIDVMLRPLLASSPKTGESLLDVGCGFGFSLSYWNKFIKGDVVGLESAEYGKTGKKILGVNIYPEYLQDCNKIKGMKFDNVYSSEVIEHVTDPANFISQLKIFLEPGGVLALTTPNAGYIKKENETSAFLTAALSPGFHYFLLSEKALYDLLKAQGFKYVKVVSAQTTLVAWASDKPVTIKYAEISQPREYLPYLEYLTTLTDPNLRSGALFRLFKELVNKGRYEEAGIHFENLKTHIKNHYDFSIYDASKVLHATNIDSFEEYSKLYPHYLPALLFYAGIFEGNHINNQLTRALLFELSYQLILHAVKNWKSVAQESESLRDAALFHAAQSSLHRLMVLSPIALGKAIDETGSGVDAQWIERENSELLQGIQYLNKLYK